MGHVWPTDADALIARQDELAEAAPCLWRPHRDRLRVGGCSVCFPRGVTGPGSAADPAWAAAVGMTDGQITDQRVTTGPAWACSAGSTSR
jgi:deoxyribonuclease V